jgi:(4-(4-[2-(gamma-L-glutamylamino)ethyl]phenoxymethyl)furan-2-yl)methanamine synthase
MTHAHEDDTTETKESRQAWLGLDVGGANLKAAHTSGWNQAASFPMWREARGLAKSLARLIESAPPFDGVAVTMTGELADCFSTRAEGVAVILEQITCILPAPTIRVYCVDGQWRTPSQAARDPWLAAASNWHALARWAGRWLKYPTGVVVDVGSTTIDVIPIHRNGLATRSKTDSERMLRGELLYTGIERSNLAGLIRSAPLYGRRCPVMNELFATTRDAYLWLGKSPCEPNDCNTADGQPATRERARYRLARIVGEDSTTLADCDVTEIAKCVYERQSQLLAKALTRVTSRLDRALNRMSAESTSPRTPHRRSIILSGHGGFLVDQALKSLEDFAEVVRLEAVLGPNLSRSAPAYAVASLAAEAPHAHVEPAPTR